MSYADKPYRVEQAVAFLRFLVQGCSRDHVLALTEVNPKHAGELRVRSYFYLAEDYARAASKAVELCLDNRTNLYVQCTLLKSKPVKGRGTKELVAGGTVLWVDIDATPTRNADHIIEDLKHFVPRPSWANISGGGVHAYWKLSDFASDWKAIEDRNRWLMQQLGKDGCWDAAHVLRVPGTQNLKLEGLPREVLPVEGLCTGTEYALEDFPSAAPSQEDSKLNLAVEEEALPPDFLDKLPSDLRQRVEIGPLERADRSANDWYCARKLLELGFTSGQILTVLTHPTWYSGEKARTHGYKYPTYTVSRAIAEHVNKYRSTGVELQPVIDAVLIAQDEKGLRRKVPLLQGSDFIDPAIRHLESKGYRFYYDRLTSQPYIVAPTGDSVLAVSGPDYERWIYTVSGFTAEEREHRVLKSGLSSHIREYGTSIKLAPWCFHDSTTHTVYVLMDQHGRDVLRTASRKAPEVVPNGTDGIVLQKSSLSAGSLKWMPEAEWSQTMPTLISLTSRQFAMAPNLQALLTCYMLAAPLVYGYRISTLPLLHLTGAAGHGKSQTLGMLSTFLHGHPELLNKTTIAAAYRLTDREILLPFDDYERLEPDLKQFILTSATGATRHKSGAGTQDTARQTTHTLLALTSISQLEEAAARRRALVVRVDKRQHRTTNYTEAHWHKIAEKRSWLWSGYMKWVSAEILPSLDVHTFNKKVAEVESLIEVSAFGGLAGFLALSWIISSKLEKFAPDLFKSDRTFLSTWLKDLDMQTTEEIDDRNDCAVGIDEVFEVAQRGAEGETLFTHMSKVIGRMSYENVTRVVQTVLRDSGFRVHVVKWDKLPRKEGKWFGLEGSVTEWVATVKHVTRGRVEVTPANFGHVIGNLLGHRVEIPEGTRESPNVYGKNGYCYARLKNAGPTRDRFGWRISIKLPPPEEGDDD